MTGFDLASGLTPAHVLKRLNGIHGPIACDTETNGKYASEGARVATVSVAWAVRSREIAETWRGLGAHIGRAVVTEGPPTVRGAARELGSQGLAQLLQSVDAYGGTQPIDQLQAETIALWLDDVIDQDGYTWVISTAWPFDQGSDGKIPLKKRSIGQTTLWPDAPNLDALEWFNCLDLLRLHKPGLVFHGGKFDLDKLRAGVRHGRYGSDLGESYDQGVELTNQMRWCTELGCRHLWPLGEDPTTHRPTRGLKPTAHRLWGSQELQQRDHVKEWIKKNLPPGNTGRYDLAPWDVIGGYADDDARKTIRLYLRQLDELYQQALRRSARPTPHGANRIGPVTRSHRVMSLLLQMEKRGLPYDDVKSAQQVYELETRARALALKLPFTPATLPAAKQFYFGDGSTARRGVTPPGLDPYAKTEKGEPQMDEQVVKRMLLDRVVGIAEWADHQKALNAASKWYAPFAEKTGPDGRLRTWFKQLGTDSTRFSVEGVNLQAVPQDYRLEGYAVLDGVPTPRALVASGVERYAPDMKLWELDLAQAELRLAAMWARCRKMLAMMTAGEDLHSYTTKALFPGINPGSHEWGAYRQVGKRGNFSLCFGSGWETFAWMIAKETGIRLSEKESKRIVRDWNRLYPEYRPAIDAHSRVVEERQRRYGRGWVKLINGERRWFAPYEETHKAFNQRVQGSLAQFGIDWMLWTDAFLSGQSEVDRNTAGLVLVIHDSQVLLLPAGQGRWLADRCAQYGRDLWVEWFPAVPGDVEVKEWKAA